MLILVSCGNGRNCCIIVTQKEGIKMLNENIKSLRKSNGLSQEQLANEMHVVRQTVSKWERGLSVPDSDSLIKLS
ncbi:MAG: helix-turn-helix transcriptional regulator [Finegoldia magna]|nr:helix-turn-helix transcriptional regulator [Finegoldia magna]